MVVWLAWCPGSRLFWPPLGFQPTNSFRASARRGRVQTIFSLGPRLFCSGRSCGSRPRPLASSLAFPAAVCVVIVTYYLGREQLSSSWPYLDSRGGFHAGGISILVLARVVRSLLFMMLFY